MKVVEKQEMLKMELSIFQQARQILTFQLPLIHNRKTFSQVPKQVKMNLVNQHLHPKEDSHLEQKHPSNLEMMKKKRKLTQQV